MTLVCEMPLLLRCLRLWRVEVSTVATTYSFFVDFTYVCTQDASVRLVRVLDCLSVCSTRSGIVSLFFLVDRNLSPCRLVFNFPERSGNHAENLRLPKHPTMMSHVDHDIAMVGWLWMLLFWTWTDILIEKLVLHQNVSSGPRKIKVSGCFSLFFKTSWF